MEYKYYKSKTKKDWEEVTVDEVKECFADRASKALERMQEWSLVVCKGKYYYKAELIKKS